MSFGKSFKIFQLNVLRQLGVQVTPQQVGLKSDPIADLQAKNAAGSFSSILGLANNSAAGMNGLTVPQPPTPPTDTTDQAAMLKYQQDLLTYNQSYQLYNQRFMQMLLGQFQSMQQTILTSVKNNTASSNSTSSDATVGTGGIL